MHIGLNNSYGVLVPRLAHDDGHHAHHQLLEDAVRHVVVVAGRRKPVLVVARHVAVEPEPVEAT